MFNKPFVFTLNFRSAALCNYVKSYCLDSVMAFLILINTNLKKIQKKFISSTYLFPLRLEVEIHVFFL